MIAPSASVYRGAEDVRVLAVIVAELKLRDVQRQRVARMERSEIRGGIDASRLSRITLRSIRATLLGGPPRAICAAISSRTPNKDSFAAPKILLLKDFLHFARCTQMRDLTAGPCCGSAILDAPRIRAPAKTRMNTRLSPDHDRPKPAVTFLLTRVSPYERWRTSLT